MIFITGANGWLGLNLVDAIVSGKTEKWGLLNLSYIINKNTKGNYIHFKIKGANKIISELEKNEKIDKNLLRYMTVKVKKFDLETNYFSKEESNRRTEKR